MTTIGEQVLERITALESRLQNPLADGVDLPVEVREFAQQLIAIRNRVDRMEG